MEKNQVHNFSKDEQQKKDEKQTLHFLAWTPVHTKSFHEQVSSREKQSNFCMWPYWPNAPPSKLASATPLKTSIKEETCTIPSLFQK